MGTISIWDSLVRTQDRQSAHTNIANELCNGKYYYNNGSKMDLTSKNEVFK